VLSRGNLHALKNVHPTIAEQARWLQRYAIKGFVIKPGLEDYR
jgi:hypothetical protein